MQASDKIVREYDVQLEKRPFIDGSKPVVYRSDTGMNTVVQSDDAAFISSNYQLKEFEYYYHFVMMLVVFLILAIRLAVSLTSYKFQVRQVEKYKKKLKKVPKASFRYRYYLLRLKYYKFLVFGGCKNDMCFNCNECEQICCPYCANRDVILEM